MGNGPHTRGIQCDEDYQSPKGSEDANRGTKETMNGTVTKFEKSYGFIKADNGRSVFVHYSDILSEGYRVLHEGDKVSFDIEPGERGPIARRVRLLYPEN
jgi:CspA family cold shock protein